MAESATIISSMATKQMLAELVDAYTKQTGNAVRLESVGGVEAARRIRAGECFDIALLASDAVEALSSEGFLDRRTVRVFARSRTAVAVQAGTSRPVACDEASVKDLIARARLIGLSTGPSGASIVRMLRDWGVYETTKSRIVQAPPGVPVSHLLNSGEVDVGFQQLSELQGGSGIEIVGTLPESLQPMTLFAVGIMHRASDSGGAQALVRFLLSDETNDTKRRNGMEPA